MANRYKNKIYGRRENREGYRDRPYGYGRSNIYRSSEDNPERYGGSDEDFSYDRDENYFGSGRQQFGQGYTGSETSRGYGSYRRGFEEDRITGAYRGGGSEDDRERFSGNYGRGNYERGYYGRDRLNDYNNEYYNRSSGGPYGRGYSEPDYYPESERGYDFENDDYQDDRGWWDKTSDEVSSWFGDEEAARRRRMDARHQGQHRGRGPRNYKRSDERIKEDINDRLTDYSYLDASDIEVEVSSCDVILSGTVDSRYAKRVAEDIAEDVSGVTNVENRLRVNQSYYGQEDSSFAETPSNTTGTTTGSQNITGSSSTTDTIGGKSRSKTTSS